MDKQWLRFGLKYKKRRNYHRWMALTSRSQFGHDNHMAESDDQRYHHYICRVLYKSDVAFHEHEFLRALSKPHLYGIKDVA